MRLPIPIMVHLDFPAELVTFADIAASDSGNVILALERNDGAADDSPTIAIRYDALTASWDPPQTLVVNTVTGGDKLSVGFLTNRRAVVTYETDVISPVEVNSILFDGTAWLTDSILEVQGEGATGGLEEAVDDGDMLLSIDRNGHETTWLLDSGGTSE
jgi:hypothetical protein